MNFSSLTYEQPIDRVLKTLAGPSCLCRALVKTFL